MLAGVLVAGVSYPLAAGAGLAANQASDSLSGLSTEVIALFDTDLMSRGKVGARSVHMFVTTSSTASASDNDGVTTVPSRRLNPVDGVEQSVGATVARIHCVNTLNVVVAALVEQLHKNRLDRLRLVEQGLSADLEAANGLGVDVVLLEKRGHGSQGERVDVCTEIC